MPSPRSDIAPQLLAQNALRGILYMCLAVSLFPVMNASVKYLNGFYPVSEVVWARYAGHLAFILIAFMPRHGLSLFKAQRPGTQTLRSLLLLGATAFYFNALTYIPMPTAATISFVSPLIVTALAMPVLGEHVGPRRWIAVVVGFLGAVVIIRPGLGAMHWAVFLALGSASCYALYQILTRRLGSFDSAETTITYTAFVGVVGASLVAPFDWTWPTAALHWVLFIGLGAIGGFGHYFVVKAFQYGSAAVISPFNYVQLVGATVLGYVIFDDFPDIWTWVGAAIIVASGLYITYRETRRIPGA